MKKLIALALSLLILLPGSSLAVNDFGSAVALVGMYNAFADGSTGAEHLDMENMTVIDGMYIFSQSNGITLYFDGTEDLHISMFTVKGPDPISLLAPGMTAAQICIKMTAMEYQELLKYAAWNILRVNAGRKTIELPAIGWGGAVIVRDDGYFLIYKENGR